MSSLFIERAREFKTEADWFTNMMCKYEEIDFLKRNGLMEEDVYRCLIKGMRMTQKNSLENLYDYVSIMLESLEEEEEHE